MAKKPMPPSPRTGTKARHLGGVGLKNPNALSPKQVQTLAASVESHIEPRRNALYTHPRSPKAKGRR